MSIKFDYYYGKEAESFSFFRIPKLLFTDPIFTKLSSDAKVLYGILLDRMSLSMKNKWMDEANKVYIIFTIEEVEETMNFGRNKAINTMKELESFGLIEKKRRGLGKPNIIYVKNFLVETKNRQVEKKQETVVNIDHIENYPDNKFQKVSNINLQKFKNQTSRSLENKLNNFGDVNLLAINEFKQLKERYDYLARERDDVVKSRKQVMDLIQEIDERIHEDFHTTYQNINENFNKMCDETIRNTEGRLNIINPEDFENCGIEIFVKFKNKKKQPLSLLSGGEKSMVAIAFIMAIFMYKPSPFTFLDEIEAALDEKNTKNLLGKLRDFTDKSQFILITHNKETMKESDSIFGVTMNKEIGISKIVSPDKITKILSENKENN